MIVLVSSYLPCSWSSKPLFLPVYSAAYDRRASLRVWSGLSHGLFEGQSPRLSWKRLMFFPQEQVLKFSCWGLHWFCPEVLDPWLRGPWRFREFFNSSFPKTGGDSTSVNWKPRGHYRIPILGCSTPDSFFFFGSIASCQGRKCVRCGPQKLESLVWCWHHGCSDRLKSGMS